ncbi:hypothetical protein HPB52_021768 [Rhipicephalus sanguineus]|uniref:Selenophosphate synthetase n=1 Tax=Rhipicephalus sanguineus TaxID=34632 RepID=A0A9D4PDE7_RHISA|nr:hypothetical protein HPB52_021768 [Rhipicephalus sanguineus]
MSGDSGAAGRRYVVRRGASGSVVTYRPFDNAEHGLEPEFRLLDIGMDSSVVPLGDSGFSLVQTIDYFYPSVDDPYIAGKIACANVLSDLYALGVTRCDNMLMVMAVSTKLTEKQRDIVVPLLIKGIKDLAEEAGTKVTGGQTVLNPWPMIGRTMLKRETCLVLTKPLGTQVAVNAHQWLEKPERRAQLDKAGISEEDVHRVYFRAMDCMARLNLTGAQLMHKHGCHGATDVTGFGLLGHAQNLVQVQQRSLGFVIHTLPIIAKVPALLAATGTSFKLMQGYSAETSGGLLMCLPKEKAQAYCAEIEQLEGYPAWIIGDVVEGEQVAKLTDSPRVIEVPSADKESELW